MIATGAHPTVIGVDIGTTSTKVVAYDELGTRHAEAEHGYPLDEPHLGHAVQDPRLVRAAVRDGLREVVAALGREGRPVAGVCFSSAMHSLLAVDASGEPLTPSITWADTRAVAQAEQLRSATIGRDLHQRSGTPVHPMSPLTKLVWFREHEPEVFAAAHCWMGIKEHVLARLTGEVVMDRSIASATGLLDLTTLDWWPQALAVAGVRVDQLPPVVPTTHRLALTPEAAADIGLGADVPLVVGAGDGPLANVGAGAVGPGVAACSIGTSGALRVVVEQPAVDPLGRVFCYALDDDRWVVGGAISNGGVVLDWAAHALAPHDDRETLLRLAESAPAGSDGLLMLPYLLSERAPHWSALARGAYVGLTRAHGRPHLVRAALEGVCQQLALVLQAVRSAGYEVRQIRATGGLLRDPFPRQLLTDVLGTDIAFTAAAEGSALGAALLGMRALGIVDTLDVAADLVPITETLHPAPAPAAVYLQQRPVFDTLFDALTPASRALRRISGQP
ncbi:MAG: carbohydrate kinase [Acidimicrobiales bacterium]|nr:carbohydrate kinase [Acidimicrobiales bacterium]